MSIGLTLPCAQAEAFPVETVHPCSERALSLRDYPRSGDGLLSARAVSAATYEDPRPGTLFSDPAWLRAYGMDDLRVFDPVAGSGAPRLVFVRRGDHFVHCGRLLRLDAPLIDATARALFEREGAAFVLFEDLVATPPLEPTPARSVFRYQNNWRLCLSDPSQGQMSQRAAQGMKRKLRGLMRDHPQAALTFGAAPDRDFLRRTIAFNRAKVEAQGRRFGIDEAELDRLHKVASVIGYGAKIAIGGQVVSGDLICVSGGHAYFLNGGYDPDFRRYSPGIGTLMHGIEQCRAEGVVTMNLLWGDMEYKERLGARCVPLQTVVVRRSAAVFLRPSHLAVMTTYGWRHAKQRIKPWVRWVQARRRTRGDAPAPPGASED